MSQSNIYCSFVSQTYELSLSLMEAAAFVFQKIVSSRIPSFCHLSTQTLALHKWYFLFTGPCCILFIGLGTW